MVDDRDSVLAGLKSGETARLESLKATASAFGDDAPDELDSWIEVARADRAIAILEKAADKTPEFLRGVLLSFRQCDDLWHMLEQMRRDLEWGAKFQHEQNRQAKADQAMTFGILTGLLNRAVGERPSEP